MLRIRWQRCLRHCRVIRRLSPFTTGNSFWGTKLLGFSIGRGSGALNPFTTGNPFLGTKLLGFSTSRGLGGLKGLRG